MRNYNNTNNVAYSMISQIERLANARENRRRLGLLAFWHVFNCNSAIISIMFIFKKNFIDIFEIASNEKNIIEHFYE